MTSTATVTPTVTAGVHDANLRRIHAAFATGLSPQQPVLKEIGVQVRNDSDHVETIGVYMDIVPPGGVSDPYGCLPNGRILQTTVILQPKPFKPQQTNVFADTGTMGDGLVEFSCADPDGAAGKSYKIFAAVDAHADDLAQCLDLVNNGCFAALADDDGPATGGDTSNNRATVSKPRVQ